SSGSNSLSRVATDGNGNWVAVGRFVVATSNDNGATFTSRYTPAPINTFETIYGYDTDGQGRWLALAASSGIIRPYYSDNNGESWTQVQVTGFATGGFALSLGEGVWLAAD